MKKCNLLNFSLLKKSLLYSWIFRNFLGIFSEFFLVLKYENIESTETVKGNLIERLRLNQHDQRSVMRSRVELVDRVRNRERGPRVGSGATRGS